MKAKTSRRIGWVIGVVAAVLVFLAILALSWIFTCVVIKLITLCFDLTFSWGIATGIWLIMYLARYVFQSNTTVKK